MTNQEALEWCLAHHATVHFYPSGVKVEIYVTSNHYTSTFGDDLPEAVRRADRRLRG